AALLFAVPEVAGVVSNASGADPRVVQPLLSVMAAAGLVPGHRLLQPRIERLVFRERFALRTGVDALLGGLADGGGPEELFTMVGERLDALVHPASCRIYVPLGDSYAPVFARGSAGPPTLSADGAVIGALRAHTAPFDWQQWARSLAARERAALEPLEAVVLVPVRRAGELAAAICLGPKVSGDVYTTTDLALLAAVAEKGSAELLRFNTAVILRQEREMNTALRRYVPEPVAVRLTRGEEIEGGEQDVSVLFVDIRSYTAFSEQQTAGTVFSMVNRYTEAVSAVIQRRGGTVVEVLADGLLP